MSCNALRCVAARLIYFGMLTFPVSYSFQQPINSIFETFSMISPIFGHR